MSLVTILRMPTVSSSKMHVAVLSIVDNLAICVKLMIHQLTKHKVGLGDAGCKVGTVLFFSTSLSLLSPLFCRVILTSTVVFLLHLFILVIAALRSKCDLSRFQLRCLFVWLLVYVCPVRKQISGRYQPIFIFFSLKDHVDSSVPPNKEDSTGNCSTEKVEKSELCVACYAAIYLPSGSICYSRSPRILQQPQSVFRGSTFLQVLKSFLLQCVGALSSIITGHTKSLTQGITAE